jgi:hypothetical protein
LLISREPQYRRGIFDGGKAISSRAKIWIAQAAQLFGSRHGQCDAAKIVYRHRVFFCIGVSNGRAIARICRPVERRHMSVRQVVTAGLEVALGVVRFH